MTAGKTTAGFWTVWTACNGYQPRFHGGRCGRAGGSKVLTAGEAVCTENCAHCHRATGQREGRRGAGACVMASQARQENFSRTCAITFHWRGISSSVSVTSSPILRSLSSPQHGQTGTSSPNSTLLPRVRWPTVRVRLADLGVDIPPPDAQTPEALGALQKSEIEKWWPIIEAANILGGVRPDARTKPQGLECCDAQAMTALGLGCAKRSWGSTHALPVRRCELRGRSGVSAESDARMSRAMPSLLP